MDQLRLDIYSPDYELREQVTDYRLITCVQEVNKEGELYFALRDNHPAIDSLEHRGIVELWRKNKDLGLDWRRESVNLFTAQVRGGKAPECFQAWCPGPLWLLASRIVAYYDGLANRSAFTAVAPETIAKTLVDYNAGANATVANGRLRAGAISGLICAADQGRGTVQSWECSCENLLLTLQRLAKGASVDFDLAIGVDPASRWAFEWYPGQLGTDRSATVIFSTDHGNMGEPAYQWNRRNGKSVAIVGGPGAGALRTWSVVQGSDYAAADNDTEIFLSDIEGTTTAMLTAAGAAELSRRMAKEEIGFRLLQTPATFYGKHYFLGDKVTARYSLRRYQGASVTQKVYKALIATRVEGGINLHVYCR